MSAFTYSSAPEQAAPPPEVPVPAAFRLPVVEERFPRHRHPYWPRLQETTREWLLEKRLMPPEKVARYADDLRYTDLVAGYYTGAPDEVLSAIADFSAWFFVWDDIHDRDAVHGRSEAWRRLSTLLHAALDAPESHLHHEDPLVAAFADTIVRIFSYLGPRWNARFAEHFHSVIAAYDQEFENRRNDCVPPVDAYVELRRHTFGHWVWLDLLELAAQCELPAVIRTDPAYRRAALTSQDFSAWYNDLCSLPKEMAGGEVHNLGISIIHHKGMTPDESMAEVRRRVGTCTADFLEAEQEVLRLAAEFGEQSSASARTADGIRSCLFNMRNWFSSVYWFHHESGRYRVDTWEDRSNPPYISDPAGEV
ncbi:multidrug MFS transporter [Streptomyces sp. NPDC058045]|uniref:terpene synthase family protein n=1 Tax=Streptomyces sp. NPDC058045 TaxID=3346311 RepID=UPI0036EEE21C